MRYRSIEDKRYPNLCCHSDEMVLTLENATKGEDLEEISHLYTPSLVRPCERIVPVCRTFTKKKRVRIQQRYYSIYKTERFLCLLGTQKNVLQRESMRNSRKRSGTDMDDRKTQAIANHNVMKTIIWSINR